MSNGSYYFGLYKRPQSKVNFYEEYNKKRPRNSHQSKKDSRYMQGISQAGVQGDYW